MSMDDFALAPLFPRVSALGVLQVLPDFLEKLPVAIYACDSQGRICWFNHRATQLWGRAPRLGENAELLCGSDDLGIGSLRRKQSPMAEVLKSGLAVRGAENLIERPDGSRLRVMEHVEPLEDEDGKLLGAVSCFQQASETPTSIAERRSKRPEQQDLFDNCAVGIQLVSRDGSILRANDAQLRLLGYCREEYVGSKLAAFHIDLPALDRLLSALASGAPIANFSAKLRARDGSIKDVLISSARSQQQQHGVYCFTIDVTELKRSEAVLRERDQQLAATYGHPGIGIVELDAEGKVLRVNAQFCVTYGYSQEQLVGRAILADIHPEHLERDREQFRRLVRGEIDRYAVETRIRNRDGDYVWVSVTSSSVRDADGRFLYAVGVHSDISSRKRVDNLERRLSAIVESSDDAIISKDLNGTITSWNRAAELLFGYKAAEVIGKSITILIPPDRRDEEFEILRRIRSGQHVDHYETLRQRKDGSLVHISLTVSPVRDGDGRIIGASKIARDISQSKQAEASLRESERRLQEILAAMPAAVYATDAQGRITYYNQAAVELAGREPKLGVDEWCVTWKLYRPDGTPLPHDQCPMAIALKEGRPIRNAEAIAERPDGTRRPFIPYPTPLRDGSGKIVGAINMLVDVSERKEAETQHKILLDELNHRVKNNMQMLQGMLYAAARETRSAVAKRVLADASQRIASMAAAQRVLYGASGATCFSAEEFLRGVCETARQGFGRDVNIVYEEVSGQLPNDAAIPVALIVNELLTNAVKHGLKGLDHGTIRVGLQSRGESFVLYVEDDGPGFELQAIRKGLSGLALVQGLARQLGATFQVKHTPATRCMLQFH